MVLCSGTRKPGVVLVELWYRCLSCADSGGGTLKRKTTGSSKGIKKKAAE